MTIKNTFIKFFIVVCCLSFSQSAIAHALRAVAQFDGKQITGMAYYSDFSVAVKTYFQVRDGTTEKFITEGITDDEGNFSIAIPDDFINEDIEYEVIVEGEEGHRVSIIAPKLNQGDSDLNENDAISQPNAQSNGLTSNDLMQLRTDIQQLKEKLYFHDIISGIGYIIGIFGLLAFIASRRR